MKSVCVYGISDLAMKPEPELGVKSDRFDLPAERDLNRFLQDMLGNTSDSCLHSLAILLRTAIAVHQRSWPSVLVDPAEPHSKHRHTAPSPLALKVLFSFLPVLLDAQEQLTSQ